MINKLHKVIFFNKIKKEEEEYVRRQDEEWKRIEKKQMEEQQKLEKKLEKLQKADQIKKNCYKKIVFNTIRHPKYKFFQQDKPN